MWDIVIGLDEYEVIGEQVSADLMGLGINEELDGMDTITIKIS